MDWRDGLKSHIDEYNDLCKKISRELSELASSLKVQPYGYTCSTTLKSKKPLAWLVKFQRITDGLVNLEISLDEIKAYSAKEDESGYPVYEVPENLSEVLKIIILRKIKEELPM